MKAVLVLGAVVLLASCSTTKRVETAKTMEIYGPGVIQNPVLAELDVKEQRVRGTATARGSATAELKNQALVNAIRTANADVLVAPVYEMETVKRHTTITVTGFPATYKNFRSATPADSSLVSAGYMQLPQTAVANDPTTRKGGAGWAAAGIVTIVGLLVFILAL
ncbi:MAG: hypothetical protein KF905_04785 [Flavobacteriales bacterium]|nr:hypothetical protein [Flavobacteriales bacterium]